MSPANRASRAAGRSQGLAGCFQLRLGEGAVLGLPLSHRGEAVVNLEGEPRGVGDPNRHADAAAGGRVHDLLAEIRRDRNRKFR